MDAVVDPGQEHRLVADGQAGLRQLVDRPTHLRRDLVRVVEVEVDPERVVLLEHRAQLVVDPLGQEDRHPRTDPDDLDVGDLAQPAEDRLEQLRGEGQSVTTRDEDVADLRRPAQVVELGLVILPVEVLGRVADDPRSGAVAAVARALGRDEHQDPIRVAMDETGHGRVAVLGQRVLHHRGEGLLLASERDHLATDRVVGVLRVDQADEVGRDVDPELVRGAQTGSLLIGELEDLLDLLEVVDPVAELPAPVVPLLVGDVGPQRRPAADGRPAIRTEDQRRIAPVHERHVLDRLEGGLVGDRGLDLLRVQRVRTSVRRRIKSMQSGCCRG